MQKNAACSCSWILKKLDSCHPFGWILNAKFFIIEPSMSQVSNNILVTCTWEVTLNEFIDTYRYHKYTIMPQIKRLDFLIQNFKGFNNMGTLSGDKYKFFF